MNDILVCKAHLKQKSCPLPDVAGKVREEFEHIRPSIRPGMRIAITAGSRGISNLELIIRTLVTCLHEAGADPFIIPAMGSHGGATAEGQLEVLRGYGITQARVGAPVRSSMETVLIGRLTEPVSMPVYMDKFAYESDGVIAVNRVKLHTDFHGPHESGIVKMLTIGLGKAAQAAAVHLYGANGLRDYIPYVSRRVLESGKILGALAILEDGYEQTADLRMALPDELFDLDSEFLARSKELFAKLPVKKVDALIVDRMGKEISGTGMDPNVICRTRILGQAEDPRFECSRLAVLSLTEASHGNALGVGLADVTTKSLADSIDWDSTNRNVWTSGFLQRGFLPAVAPNDKEAVSLAIRTCGTVVTESFRLARIRDTLHLDEAYFTRSLLEEAVTAGLAEQISDFRPLEFDAEGRIAPF